MCSLNSLIISLFRKCLEHTLLLFFFGPFQDASFVDQTASTHLSRTRRRIWGSTCSGEKNRRREYSRRLYNSTCSLYRLIVSLICCRCACSVYPRPQSSVEHARSTDHSDLITRWKFAPSRMNQVEFSKIRLRVAY